MRHSRRPDAGNRVIALKKRRSGKPRRLPGPTVAEMIESGRPDALPPFDDNGQVAWTFEGQSDFQRGSGRRLMPAGLKTVGEVREASDAMLLNLQDLGPGSVAHLRETLGLPSTDGVRPVG